MIDKIPPAPRDILEKMSAGGYSCYLVGGSVRDLLLSRRPADYDFVTDRRPAQIIAAAEEADWKALQHGIHFGVVSVLIQGKSYEIATMRTEAYGADPHRPASIEFLDELEKDLARRDFTINAMAMDIEGRVIDPFGGREDLKKQLIRCVGEPRHRFLEDPLRILRAARFIARTGFKPDQDIATAAGDREVRRRFAQLSVERVRDELEKILLSPFPSRSLRYLVETGMLELSCSMKTGAGREAVPILPEIAAMQGVAQNPRFHTYDVLGHTLEALDRIPAQPVLRWAALLHDVAKGTPGVRCLNRRGEPADYGHAGAGAKLAGNILKRLRLPAEITQLVAWLVRNHMVLPDADDKRMARWVKKHSRDFPRRQAFAEAAQFLFLLAQADSWAKGKGADPAYLEAVTESFHRVMAKTVLYTGELAINGTFIAHKVGRGPLVGKILRDLLVDVQSGRLKNNSEELQAAVNKKVKRLALGGNTVKQK